ncbi:hypothetical protein QYE76_064938 [Lolium multiflorum]|uniref:Retrotransposon gag domain-containing protein n=1 Tax=Lolium multiflorum TaxID=4521 RepID=A0AAD8W8E2_LOLMU|nr:hypothetical protein QYE76_064938 [Lolium multiflorum]
MADGTPVTYGDLPDDLKKQYNEIKATLEADLIGSFQRTRTNGIRWKGFSPQGALDGIDLSTPSEERTRGLRQEINYLVAHSLHRHSENLVNVLERVALRVIQEIMSHQYSPSGPALGTHQGELPFQSRPPLPYALAAPAEVPTTPAFLVYRIGGDPSDYQFLMEAPKEIPHGYACMYVPDCGDWALTNQATTSGTPAKTGGTSATEKTWLTKYATPTKLPSPAPADGSELEKQTWQAKAVGYSKPYPDDYEMIPLPPKYRLPDFSKFSGSDGSSSIEHVSRYLAQLGPASVSDQLRVRLFSQSLTGSAFGWYTSLPANSIQSWKQLEEQFHMQYHSEASESGIADLAQLRQKRGETVTEYIQRFRNLRNRCYSVRITEKEAVELAVAGLATQLKDMASQADYPSLAHMVQKLSHMNSATPTLAEWTRGGTPVACKWVKPPGPPRGFDFDVTKTEQIFDLLLKEKQLTVPEGLKFPTAKELNGKPYCKFHNSLSHATNDCRVWRQHIQAAIEKGRLIFNQYAMKVDTQPFPAVNMVEITYPEGCQPGPSFSINMVGLGNHSGKDGDEGSCSHSKDTEEAAPRDRLRHDGKRYVTEGETLLGFRNEPIAHNRQLPRMQSEKKEAANVSVFERLGPLPPQSKRAESPRWADLEDSEDEGEVEEDRYHRPRWCPDGLSRSQKRRVQRLRGLEEAERLYLHTLRKARPDLAAKVQRTLDEEGRPRKMEWRPKQRKADDETSAGTNMVLVLPTERSAPRLYGALKVDDSKRIKSEVGLVLSSLTK